MMRGVIRLKRNHLFLAYVLIGIGLYFLLKQINIPFPFIENLTSWPTLIIIIGIALLLHSYAVRDYENLFSGTIVLGIGIHLHGLQNYTNWINHWAVYLLIVGIAFIVRFFKTKNNFFIGLMCVVISILFIFPINTPLLRKIHSYDIVWPIGLIMLGIYLLRRK